MGEQEIKIATWGRVLLSSFFCVVNLDFGKFGGHSNLSFYERVKGKWWSQINYWKMRFTLSHGMFIVIPQPHIELVTTTNTIL